MTDLLDQLRQLDPCRSSTPSATSATRVDNAIEQLVATGHPAARSRRATQRWGLALVATTAATVAVAVGLPGQGEKVGEVAPASAAAVLKQLQQTAASAPTSRGRYAYRKTLAYSTHMGRTEGGKDYAVVLPETHEEWVDAHGVGVERTHVDQTHPSFPTPEDKTAYESSTLTPTLPFPEGPYEIPHFTILGLGIRQVTSLPTDPRALRARLAAIKEPGLSDDPIVPAAASLLSTPVTPHAVRVALLAVLREEPGASVIADMADPEGRHGVGIRFISSAWVTTFLFDLETSELLATRSEGLKELPGRSIVDWDMILESGWADEAPKVGAMPRMPPLPPVIPKKKRKHRR